MIKKTRTNNSNMKYNKKHPRRTQFEDFRTPKVFMHLTYD